MGSPKESSSSSLYQSVSGLMAILESSQSSEFDTWLLGGVHRVSCWFGSPYPSPSLSSHDVVIDCRLILGSSSSVRELQLLSMLSHISVALGLMAILESSQSFEFET